MQKIRLWLITENDSCNHLIKKNLADLVEVQKEILITDFDQNEINESLVDVIFISATGKITEPNHTSNLNELLNYAHEKNIPVVIYGNGNTSILKNILKLSAKDRTTDNLESQNIKNIIKSVLSLKSSNENSLINDPYLLLETVENLMSPLLVLDLNGKIIYVNEAQEALHKYSRNELIGKNVDLLSFDEPGLISTRNIIQEVVIFGNWQGELVEKNKAGEKISLLARAKLLKDQNNLPKAVIISAHDITSKKILEEENNRYKQAMQHSHEIIFMTNKSGIINYVNTQFENFYGYSQNEVIGKKPNFLKSGFTNISTYEEMWAELNAGKIYNTEFINKTKDNKYVTLEASISPYFDERSKIAGFISIQRDVTDKKQNEELLRRALDKAEESDNLKNAFLNQMSHEIRTPLNSILGFMSLMEEELINRGISELAVYFDSINRSSSRLHRTIEDILAMSSIQVGNFYTSKSEIDLKEIISLIIKEYEDLAEEKKIDLIFDSQIEIPKLDLDSYTITKSFKHLIDNAVKFTNEGKITVTLYKDDDVVKVDVIDTGIGISDDYMHNLFKPFSQEEVGYNRKYDGNGLGLALTKEFLSLNHATISVVSTKGAGTKFTICFYETLEN